MNALGSRYDRTRYWISSRLFLSNGTGIQVDGRFESAIRYHGNLGIVTPGTGTGIYYFYLAVPENGDSQNEKQQKTVFFWDRKGASSRQAGHKQTGTPGTGILQVPHSSVKVIILCRIINNRPSTC